MNRFARLAMAAILPAAVVAPSAQAQLDIPDSFMPEPPPLVWDTIAYGPRRRDQIRRVKNRLPGRPPIVVWVSGQGSISENRRYDARWMPFFLFDHGLAVASVHPWQSRRPSGAEHVAKVAEGIAEVVRRADKLGYDGSRLVLLGEGWGGHIAALLGSDPSWLQAAGVPFDSVRGVILFDASGFDLAAHLRAATPWRRKQLLELAGAGPGAESKLSPITQAAAPNAPRFLFHLIDEDAARRAEAEAFAAALTAGGSEAETRQVRRTLPKSPRTQPGHRAHPEYDHLLQFLREATR